MFTRKQFVPPDTVDAPGVLNAIAKWVLSLNDKGSLEISEARINVNQGLQFPATQVASTDANNLDDYEEGTWTPVVTFATPGNLAVTYLIQGGSYTKIGRTVMCDYAIATSVFTHTTASGNLRVTGLPFTATADAGWAGIGPISWSGITKAGFTDIAATVPNGGQTYIEYVASASGVARSSVTFSDVPSGGNVALIGSMTYRV